MKKTITITTCDKCGKEIKGRLIVRTCPCCKAEMCTDCQEAEDAKTTKKKEAPEKIPTHKLGERRVKDGVPEVYVKAGKEIVTYDASLSGEHLSIHVPSGEKDDTKYKVKILNSKAEGDTLNGTVCQALIPWNGEIPETLLTETEVNTLKGILEAEK